MSLGDLVPPEMERISLRNWRSGRREQIRCRDPEGLGNAPGRNWPNDSVSRVSLAGPHRFSAGLGDPAGR
jgi:hypothetical protein